MLEIKELTKYYRNIPVVNDVSFTVAPGEVTGYLGPNGAGNRPPPRSSRRSSSRAAGTSSLTAGTFERTRWRSSAASAMCPKSGVSSPI